MNVIQKTLLATSLLAATACGGSKEQGSNLASPYPPDYSFNTKCAYNDVVEVCRSENYGNASFMRVYYKGYLRNSRELKAYIKLNGREGTFGPLVSDYNGARRVLTLANSQYDCKSIQTPQGSMSYDCTQPTAEVSDLFFYAKNQRNTFNAWDVEIAIVDQNGAWDSNLNANYKLRIDQ